MEFNWEDFKNKKIVVHCDTEEKAKDFVKECYRHRIKWLSKENDDTTFWEEYENDTFYFGSSTNSQIGILTYGNYEDAKDKTVFEWELPSSCPKLKEDMIIECRNGDRYLLRRIGGELFASSNDEYMSLDYDEELNENKYFNKDLDVMKVYTSEALTLNNLFSNDYLTCIWERKEPKKMTLAQISEALGYEVEVIDNE